MTMDVQTALVLTIQLVALFSIAGALLLYLLCKIRAEPGGIAEDVGDIGGGRAVIVTSCDTAFGLQVALHLSTRGFRVFAGIRDMHEDCTALRAARAWVKERESIPVRGQGMLVALPLDVTREDLLHEAADIIRAHLPAGEDGVWAVINTSGVVHRGKLDHQDISHWESMLKTNIIGVLRTSRAFQSLLRNTRGRFITVGAAVNKNNNTTTSTTPANNHNNNGNTTSSATGGANSDDCTGLVAYTATRYAVQGACEVLRRELGGLGIKVVTLTPEGISPDIIYAPPKLRNVVPEQKPETAVNITDVTVEIHPKVLSMQALNNIDLALTCAEPYPSYTLSPKKPWFSQFTTAKSL